MFKLFRRRRDKPSLMYGVFQKLGDKVEERQREIAIYLNDKVVKLSSKQVVIGLVLFCILFGGGAGFVIWQAFDKPTTTVRIRSISVPRHTIPSESNKVVLGLTNSEINNFQQFQQYIDSLLKTKKGKATYDSIRHNRPGLLDSLSILRKMYHEQLKNK